MEELKKIVESYEAGTEIEIVIRRMSADGYEEKTMKVTLGRREQ